MNIQVCLRPSSASDHDFLLALFEQSRPDLALLPAEVRTQLIRLQFDSQLFAYRSKAPHAIDWVLELDHNGRRESVGRCYLDRGAEEHRILDLAISARRRRQGIASRLLVQLCTDAAQARVPLRLSVWHANRDALRFYERLGFVLEPDSPVLEGYLPLCWTAEGQR